MTAEARENAQAAAAQAAGESAAAKHASDALAQHRVSGSTVAVEPAVTPDQQSVDWSNADSSAQPTLVPSEPRPVNSLDRVVGPSDAA
jgi:hypothetical protein